MPCQLDDAPFGVYRRLADSPTGERRSTPGAKGIAGRNIQVLVLRQVRVEVRWCDRVAVSRALVYCCGSAALYSVLGFRKAS